MGWPMEAVSTELRRVEFGFGIDVPARRARLMLIDLENLCSLEVELATMRSGIQPELGNEYVVGSVI